MVLNVRRLSEVDFLQFVTHNLCGFDPGSRVKISHYIQPNNLSSALVIAYVMWTRQQLFLIQCIDLLLMGYF